MHLAGCKRIARNDRVVHEHHLHPEAVFLREDTIRVWFRAVICRNDRKPAGPHVIGETQDFLIGVPLVLADALDGWKLVPGHVLVFADRGDALRIGRFSLRPFCRRAGR